MIIGILPYPRVNRILLLVPLLACFFSPAQAKRKDVVILTMATISPGKSSACKRSVVHRDRLCVRECRSGL